MTAPAPLGGAGGGPYTPAFLCYVSNSGLIISLCPKEYAFVQCYHVFVCVSSTYIVHGTDINLHKNILTDSQQAVGCFPIYLKIFEIWLFGW